MNYNYNQGIVSHTIDANNIHTSNKKSKKFYIIILILLFLILLSFFFFFYTRKEDKIEIIIKTKTEDSIILSIDSAKEDIEQYNWNSEGYTSNDTYEITEPGVYTLVVKFKNSNKTYTTKIEIHDSDFLISSEENKDHEEDKNHDKTKKTFTIKIKSNGATVGQNEVSCATDSDSCSVILPSIKRGGWTILGFSDDANATTAKYKADKTISISDNITLYAITSKKINASFNSNGASISESSQACSLYNKNTSCKVTLPSITRSNWTILGFSDVANATTAKYKVNQTISISDNITLYAITSKKINASFNSNGATISKSSQYCYLYNKNTSCKVTLPSITRSNWAIVGFSDNNNATTAKYKADETISISDNIFLYAITMKRIKAFYIPNGASISESSQYCYLYNKNTSCKVTLPSITRSNWEILGFSDNNNATTAQYKADQTISISNNTILYAITRKMIRIKIDTSEINYVEFVNPRCYIYNNNSSCNIKIPYVNKNGYIILGFNDSKNEVVEYQKYSSGRSYPFSKDTTLYISYNEKMKYFRNISLSQNSKYGNVFFERDATCNANVNYKKLVEDMHSDWPFIFEGGYGKISILNQKLFEKIYGWYGGVTVSFSNFTAVDIACGTQKNILFHEISHMYDRFTELKTGTRISQTNEFLNLYNKYKENKETYDWNDDVNNEHEFFATTLDFYYIYYFHEGGDSDKQEIFQCDLKNFVEKKILIPNGVTIPSGTKCKK